MKRCPIATSCFLQEVKRSWALRGAAAIFGAIANSDTWNGIWFTQVLRACEVRWVGTLNCLRFAAKRWGLSPSSCVGSATSFFAFVKDIKDELGLSPAVSEALAKSAGQYDVLVMLFKAFEKAKLEPGKLRSFAWMVFILARGRGYTTH